jgi:hypothetical protein
MLGNYFLILSPQSEILCKSRSKKSLRISCRVTCFLLRRNIFPRSKKGQISLKFSALSQIRFIKSSRNSRKMTNATLKS